MTCYIPRWFTRPQAVTHPSTNRAQCRLTTLIEANPLTTTLHRHLLLSVCLSVCLCSPLITECFYLAVSHVLLYVNSLHLTITLLLSKFSFTLHIFDFTHNVCGTECTFNLCPDVPSRNYLCLVLSTQV